MNHAPLSHPIVAEVSSAGKRPSLSTSFPKAICTLLDAVAVKVISALKKRVSACRGGKGTSFDDSHPAYVGDGIFVTTVEIARAQNAPLNTAVRMKNALMWCADCLIKLLLLRVIRVPFLGSPRDKKGAFSSSCLPKGTGKHP